MKLANESSLPELLSVGEAAEALRVSELTVRPCEQNGASVEAGPDGTLVFSVSEALPAIASSGRPAWSTLPARSFTPT